jgi:predicted nucleic acid-binding Zn ribbon protein
VAERKAPTRLSEALTEWVRRAGLVRRMDLARAVEEWPERVGPQIAAVTRPESVSPDGMLRVRVASAAWATELSLMTPRILARLNAGRSGRIREIRWIAGPLERP